MPKAINYTTAISQIGFILVHINIFRLMSSYYDKSLLTLHAGVHLMLVYNWNLLPHELHQCNMLSCFKSKLKTYYFCHHMDN